MTENEDHFYSHEGDTKCEVSFSLKNPPIGPREYIYNLIPQNKPRAVTKYKCLPKLRIKNSQDDSKKESMKTMGPPSETLKTSLAVSEKRLYMVKHSKKPMVKLINHGIDLHSTKRIIRKECPGKIAALPSLTGLMENTRTQKISAKCIKEDRNKINWISNNAIEAITSEPGFRIPPERQRCIVDTRKGDKYCIKSNRTDAGLEPMYVYRKQAGQIPSYLIKRMKELEKTKDIISRYNNERQLQNTDYLLTDDQRQDLLNGLKSTWDRYNRKYLGLASVNDTLKGKAYKAYLEEQLDQLKQEVDMIENHQYIFVEASKDGMNDEQIHKSICA